MNYDVEMQRSAPCDSLMIENRVTEAVYTPDTVYSRLTPSPFVEIGLVTSGNGIHRIINKELPCSEGDIFIVNANVPHGYFSAESGTVLTVRTLLFQPTDWVDAEAGTASDPHFCYGVFQEGSSAAYALLNAKTQDEVVNSLDRIEAELNEASADWKIAVRSHLALLLITVGRYINDAIRKR